MSRLDSRIFSEDFDPVRTILSELPIASSRKTSASASNANDEYGHDEDGDYELNEEIEYIEKKMADIDQVKRKEGVSF